MAGIFATKTMTMLEKTLNFRNQRHELLVSNIANKDTPGYQAEDLVFEKALGKALDADLPGLMKMTNAKHFDGRNTPPIERVNAERIRSASSNVAFDGNTVDLEKEMAKLAENQLMYNAATRMVAHQLRQLKTAITEGK